MIRWWVDLVTWAIRAPTPEKRVARTLHLVMCGISVLMSITFMALSLLP